MEFARFWLWADAVPVFPTGFPAAAVYQGEMITATDAKSAWAAENPVDCAVQSRRDPPPTARAANPRHRPKKRRGDR